MDVSWWIRGFRGVVLAWSWWLLVPPASPASTLTVRLRDARVSIQGAEGHLFSAADPVLWTRSGPGTGPYVHAEDSLQVTVPDGPVVVRAVRGLPGLPGEWNLTVQGDTTLTLPLDLWCDAPAAGWWSGDPHVHSEHGQSGSSVYDPAPLAVSGRAGRAESLELMALLDHDPAHPGGPVSPPEPGIALVWGEEYRTGFWGHVGLLDLPGLLITDGAAGCCGAIQTGEPTITSRFATEPPLTAWLAHPHTTEDPFFPDLWPGSGFARERASLALTGAVVGYAVAGGTNGLLSCWDRAGYLDGLRAGARWAAIGETDRALDRYWTGPPGELRTYARVDPAWPVGSAGGIAEWSASLRAGRTFATTGPFLQALDVGGATVGDSLLVAPATSVPVRFAVDSFAPLDTLRIHGATGVLWTGVWPGGISAVDTTVHLAFDHDDFVVAEASGPPAGWGVFPEGPRLMTSPVRIRVGGPWPVPPDVARRGVDASLFAWERVEILRGFASPAGSLAVRTQLEDSAAVYEAMVDDLPGPFRLVWPPDGSTASSPGVTFRWSASPAYDGETTTYRVALDDDPGLQSPDWVPAGTDTFVAVAGFAAGEEVWWRVEATEPGEPPVWSIDGPFTFQISEQPVPTPPSAPALRVGPVRWRNDRAAWRVDLPEAAHLTVRWYDVRGRRVRIQDLGWREAGAHTLEWDGRDANGRGTAAGTYLGVLEVGTQRRVLRTLRPGG